jgi:hypothetical protein
MTCSTPLYIVNYSKELIVSLIFVYAGVKITETIRSLTEIYEQKPIIDDNQRENIRRMKQSIKDMWIMIVSFLLLSLYGIGFSVALYLRYTR